MIKGFKCKETEKVFNRLRSKRFSQSTTHAVLKKLVMLHAASELNSLRIPPSNRLEKLHGNRLGQYSMRINAQWRLCFHWQNGDAYDVEIVDYH